ncbi:hypothetical protein SAMN05421874_11671 [Nonomuraea maritima]|uniref:Uncharacterized protein n=1 Tax=Nonomuraea maritima TaxID=683260 RepID=A0A1G9HJM6_9ACTN|nr:hypothetical protein [Nonomuraea maritima]SDL13072.1 hypothetical protein SAMN05421874_11671 [Nonomuraea maritima]
MSQSPELPSEVRKAFARFVARAWADEAVRQDYARDPRLALSQGGVDWPDDLPVPDLPARPDKSLDLESLESSAGGALGTIGTVSCPTGCFAGGQSQSP